MISRRQLLDALACLAPAAGAAAALSPGTARALGGLPTPGGLAGWLGGDLASSAPRARYWATGSTPGVSCVGCHPGASPEFLGQRHAHNGATVKCLLCAQGCAIPPGQRGRCRARQNVSGELRSLVYGRPVTTHVDPMEKKPFYHFLPGASALSFGTVGCPLRCQFCQNWEISQASPEDYDPTLVSPRQMAEAALARGAPVIAFTYNEPTVFTEYLLDVAAEARKRRTRAVLVSCGFMAEAPLADMCRALDAIKVDLKGFSEDFYHRVSGAALAPVLRSIVQIAKSGVHLEIVNLVVPTLNDDERSMTALVKWLAGEVGPDVPVHFTWFHPDFQLRNLPPTPVETLERARALAHDAGLRYAYVGNVPGHQYNHTYCPKCGKAVIERSGFFVTAMRLKDGRCESCREPIKGVWS
jgi:pyruvate formate lyase activating enzyme